MPYSASRARLALLGAACGDAAAMPLHWIYGPLKVVAAMGGAADPAFFPKPSCPYYDGKQFPGHYERTGQPSPYGEEMTALVDYLLANKGDFASPVTWTEALDKWAKTNGGRPNGCTRDFLKNRGEGAAFPACGADDAQMNSVVKAVVLSARYAGTPELLPVVEQAVRAHQNNQEAVDYALAAARILEAFITGETDDVVEAVKKTLASPATPDTVRAWCTFAVSPELAEAKDASDAVAKITEAFKKADWYKARSETMKGHGVPEENVANVLATSCGYPQGLLVALHIVRKFPKYEDAIRANVLYGGDSCSRAAVIGALTAVKGGEKAVPEAWVAQTECAKGVLDLAGVVAAKRA